MLSAFLCQVICVVCLSLSSDMCCLSLSSDTCCLPFSVKRYVLSNFLCQVICCLTFSVKRYVLSAFLCQCPTLLEDSFCVVPHSSCRYFGNIHPALPPPLSLFPSFPPSLSQSILPPPLCAPISLSLSLSFMLFLHAYVLCS